MIRPAEPSDIAAITAIINQVIRETTVSFTSLEKSEADIETMLRDRRALGHEMFVADAGASDGVVGYATYAQFRPSPGYARTMEHSVALAAAGKGRGFGRGLMQAVEAHAAAAGAHVMVAAINATNTESLRFHASLGYVQSGHLPQIGFKFGRYLDLVLMQKFLT
ncbi:MAG: N-acetyltransferase family protein [Pseudorhodobacter sp.]